MNYKRGNYLNNADLVSDLNETKKTFCAFEDYEKHSNYDYIVTDLTSIKDLKDDIITGRRKRLTKLLERNPDLDIDLESIKIENCIIRYMTFEHIPLRDKPRISKPKRDSDIHLKVNFPPFKHYELDEDLNYREVGRSHWKGTIADGEFCVTHGELTQNLLLKYVKLVERYSKKPNWSGYSYLDEMQANALIQLTEVGLKFNEANGNNPFAFLTTIVTRAFITVLHKEKRQAEIRNTLITQMGFNPSISAQVDAEIDNANNRSKLITDELDKSADDEGVSV